MIYKTFEQLSKQDLYAIAKLRQDVFIVEQNSVYVDLDDLDQSATHYLLKDKYDLLIGYGRYRALEHSKKVKVERVVLHKKHRGLGKGESLLEGMLSDIKALYPEFNIGLSSQIYACKFYHRFGFIKYGEPYDDGGIEHIDMVYQART